jgi:hypothetical protein
MKVLNDVLVSYSHVQARLCHCFHRMTDGNQAKPVGARIQRMIPAEALLFCILFE